ncbi:PAS and ANTAR domain-containing protein [Luteimicrobium subarcticum]|uniref:histidine kinase n=1 Tax=Luteimicrobium subarcticum TaxID=620910 RepID=A0A2M8WJ54_9MICO|nr:PAS and ANTAR domain-containing protein [Luteimicrobium subarcticum]PJI90959.1 PAS domain-containing protein [Luteimicrobium subarcticum]
MTDADTSARLDLQDVVSSLAAGQAQAVGRYRVDLATGQWWWSDEIYAMHGFERGDVAPSTALMLAHKHPDDRERVDRTWQEAARTGLPFSSVHRVIGGDGETRVLGVVGQGRRAQDGQVTELVGYFIDLTDSHRRAGMREAAASIRTAAESRAAIEQAKGVIITVLDLDEDEAFALLRDASNRSNVPVRTLATGVLDFVRSQVQDPDVAAQLRKMLSPPD